MDGVITEGWMKTAAHPRVTPDSSSHANDCGKKRLAILENT